MPTSAIVGEREWYWRDGRVRRLAELWQAMRDVAYVALGSNLGDRDAYLALARQRIAGIERSRILAATAVEETPPFGAPGQGRYLNQMLAVETELAPGELLAALHAIEQLAGRERTVRWGARTLDLDIVLFEHQRVSEPELQVPHLELPNREFWLRQLSALGVAA